MEVPYFLEENLPPNNLNARSMKNSTIGIEIAVLALASAAALAATRETSTAIAGSAPTMFRSGGSGAGNPRD